MTGWAAASPEMFGTWGCWAVFAAALLEAFVLTGLLVPGWLALVAGGALAQALGWGPLAPFLFATAGAAVGGELGFWMGRRLSGPRTLRRFPDWRRTEALMRRRRGLALAIGRFHGLPGGLAPFAAGLGGMRPARFRPWNAAGAAIHAAACIGAGYLAAETLARLAPWIGRDALLALGLAAALGATWLIARRIRQGLPLALTVTGMARDAALAHPAVARALAAHPATTRFLGRRFATDRFEGLTLTALLAVMAYVALAWADSALDFLRAPQVAETDLKLAQLIHALWTPEALRAFGLVTQLGHWTVVACVLAGATAALTLLGRSASLLQLWTALGGELLSVRLLKGAFARPRPELGYFVETSGSFPSGHATLSVAFWGTLAAILWRERVIGPTTALAAGAATALLVGFSRVYLIEHFLSDVVNGWLLGALWLLIGLAAAERMRAKAPEARTSRPQRAAAAAALAVTLAAAGWFAVAADPPRVAARAEDAAAVPETIARWPSDLPLGTESIGGRARAPVSALVAAPNLATIAGTLEAAGWTPVEKAAPMTLAHAAWRELTGRETDRAALLPVFWQGRPADAGFRNAGRALELRLWDTGLRTPGGHAVFAAATSGDPDRAAAQRPANPALSLPNCAGAAAAAPCLLEPRP